MYLAHSSRIPNFGMWKNKRAYNSETTQIIHVNHKSIYIYIYVCVSCCFPRVMYITRIKNRKCLNLLKIFNCFPLQNQLLHIRTNILVVSHTREQELKNNARSSNIPFIAPTLWSSFNTPKKESHAQRASSLQDPVASVSLMSSLCPFTCKFYKYHCTVSAFARTKSIHWNKRCSFLNRECKW